MEAIEKIRSIVNWASYQDEGFNLKFKTIEQLEKVYDFAEQKGYDFLDDEYLNKLTEEERNEAEKFIQNVLKIK